MLTEEWRVPRGSVSLSGDNASDPPLMPHCHTVSPFSHPTRWVGQPWCWAQQGICLSSLHDPRRPRGRASCSSTGHKGDLATEC